MMFNKWLLICFWCLNTCFYTWKTYVVVWWLYEKMRHIEMLAHPSVFVQILEVHKGYFDVEWAFELIRTTYVHVCIMTVSYMLWVICILMFTCLLLFLKA
jgi:hypothetical protein